METMVGAPIGAPIAQLMIVTIEVLHGLSPTAFYGPSLVVFVPCEGDPGRPVDFGGSWGRCSVCGCFGDYLFSGQLCRVFVRFGLLLWGPG